jgi:hypothetical protein
MRHLTDHLDEAALLDVAEGVQSEHAAAHLAGCERCRAQVEALRSALHIAEDVTVPEPSPLFWDHLSARVAEAVADERAGEAAAASIGWAARLRSWQVLTAAAVAAAVVLAVAVNRHSASDTSPVQTPAAVATAAAHDLTPSLENDPSLSFIADLASDLDWDDAVEAGLTSGADAVERVVQDMSDDERRELRRVLQEEMGRPGA